MKYIIALCLWATALTCYAAKVTITKVESAPQHVEQVSPHIGGRVYETEKNDQKNYQQQWPGIYFEYDFQGPQIFFKVGEGHVNIHISVDKENPQTLATPAPGLYAIEGLSKKMHHLRVDVVSESQSGFNIFGGFFVPAGSKKIDTPKRDRQIEFIGDSHTVGYGNISPSRECTTEEVWATTDTSQAYGPQVARHYNADYQINAISGRGVVRNYGGFAADTIPQAYPFILFDKANVFSDSQWHPRVIVISLGTNDFSTPLAASEKWKSREELHEDYEKTYVNFVQDLRKKNPDATFILWATDASNGEILSEVEKVMARLQALGEKKITLVPMKNLQMTGCHWHPSVKDDETIAAKIIEVIQSNSKIW